jgi:hypothetical protein
VGVVATLGRKSVVETLIAARFCSCPFAAEEILIHFLLFTCSLFLFIPSLLAFFLLLYWKIHQQIIMFYMIILQTSAGMCSGWDKALAVLHTYSCPKELYLRFMGDCSVDSL